MERFALAQALIQQAGTALRQVRLEEEGIREKTGPKDLVTRWDRETEQFLRREIFAAFPEDAVVGEEYPAAAGRGGATWYLDPIDGTTNFVNQRRNYAVSIGCWLQDRPLFGLVLDVERQVLYSARAGCGARCGDRPIQVSRRGEISQMLLAVPGVPRAFLEPHPYREGLARLAQEVRGVRSLGSVALELCALAAGEADLFVAMQSAPWDHNAARIILTEAGGCICRLTGEPLPLGEKSAVLAANSLQLAQDVAARCLQG